MILHYVLAGIPVLFIAIVKATIGEVVYKKNISVNYRHTKFQPLQALCCSVYISGFLLVFGVLNQPDKRFSSGRAGWDLLLPLNLFLVTVS